MPTVHVLAEELFERLGRPYTEDELENLCFSFGVELDEVTEQEGHKIYKIDVPANRYDLLCVEGLGRALKVFTSETPQTCTPSLRLSGPPVITVNVMPWAESPRPYIACAVLRGVRLSPRRLTSFIDLQDKLHHTLCRRRTLASIGTYDMRGLSPPFSYAAVPPQDVFFRPLGCGDMAPMKGDEILAHFASHQQLKQYLPMLEGQARLHLLRDSKGEVLSMPPLINGDSSRLTADSKDVFIDCTSLEARRGQIVLTLVAAMFAEYCEEPFVIEPVRIVYEGSGKETVTPCLDTREMSVDMGIVRRICGLKDLKAEEAAERLQRLMLQAVPDPTDKDNKLLVSIPPTRSDIMHACDVAEDVAIGIGFDRLPVCLAPKLASNPRSLLTQSLRALVTSLGFTECLTFALCSAEDNALSLKKPLHPPFEPSAPFNPLEVGDVVIRDDRTETKSRNLLYCCAAFADEHGSGLEEVHGLLDAVLEALGLVGDYTVAERQAAVAAGKEEPRSGLGSQTNLRCFSLKPTSLLTFLPGRQVEICVHPQQDTNSSSSSSSSSSKAAQETAEEGGLLRLGCMGTLHPDCLRAFGLAIPVSMVELTLEPFLKWLPETDLIFA